MNAIDVAVVCKALGDSTRLEIVNMISEEEKCGCKILEKFSITQPTLSHHMKILVECGLVNDRKEGKWHYYSVNTEVMTELCTCIRSMCLKANKVNEKSDCCG
ncbi:MAG: metalloregulator ArsR/SmtB family transcription factor [Eubacterium sp.]|nr:metalloregulator ArsR/SmtB family transcription factor [Eubacterium sp.]